MVSNEKPQELIIIPEVSGKEYKGRIVKFRFKAIAYISIYSPV
jgi:hypothetical protein